jgi:hypothetical protein
MASRLGDCEKYLVGMGFGVGEAIEDVQSRVSAFEERSRITSYPRLRRIPHILRLWRGGQYSSFQGWKSAVKDLMRAR